MTMPHMMNCRHRDDGWCLDCVQEEHDRTEQFARDIVAQLDARGSLRNAARCSKCDHFMYAREHCPKCHTSKRGSAPLYQHTADELRHVAGILDALNHPEPDISEVGCSGTIKIYWCDGVLGTIQLDDECDFNSWVYLPTAEPDVQQTEAPK